MEITEVKVFPIGEEKLKAFVSVVFDRCFMVNDIKIIQGRDGLFISMPSRKKKNGEFKDVAHPLNNETRRRIEGQVLGEYQRVLAERGEELPAPPRITVAPPVTDGAAASPAVNGRAAEPVDPPSEAVPVMPAGGVSQPAADGLAARAASDAGSSGAREGGSGEQEPTLEEIQELHLRDSFWSVS